MFHLELSLVAGKSRTEALLTNERLFQNVHLERAHEHDGRALAGDGYGAYVLDLCLIDGEVSIVELNGMMNAGLFALDMDALTRAMRARPGQFVPASLGGLLADRDACPVLV